MSIMKSIASFSLALEAKGLAPAAPADKRTLLRRATFDLIGLPPTPAEIDAFLADDSPQAFAKVVDRLLASPQYGERWGRHWLDVVRYADARDLIQLPPDSDFREAWRYRDWVVDSFNRDLPYTDFVRMQIAGDLLPAAAARRVEQGRPRRHRHARHRGLRARRRRQEPDDRRLRERPDRRRRPRLPRALASPVPAATTTSSTRSPPRTTTRLAGIFFSTRIIPGPVAGNTPLVRVPLLSPAEIAQQKAQSRPMPNAATELERLLLDVARERLPRTTQGPADRAVGTLPAWRLASAASGSAAARCVRRSMTSMKACSTEWVALLDRIGSSPCRATRRRCDAAASGKLTAERAAG